MRMLSSPMTRIYVSGADWNPSLADGQRIAETFGVDLNDVYEAVQKVRAGAESGPWALGPGSDEGLRVTSFASLMERHRTESVTGVRQGDVDEVTAQASRDGIAGLSGRQQMVVAVVLMAAVYPVLPPDVRSRILEDATLAAAVAAVLGLLGRS